MKHGKSPGFKEIPMKTIKFALGSILFVAIFASASMAQLQRTFVSGFGNDSNPCNHAAPCRTFTQAISQTNAGGEVYAVDSAGYGAFTITKAISIVAPQGVTAGITVFSGDGITINAGASETVILRGLTINNQGSTGNGIVVNTVGTIHIEGCVINGFSSLTFSSGINFLAGANLEVKDSIFRGNSFGIYVHPASGTAQAAIDNARLEENVNDGLFAREGSTVTVRNSLASGNGGIGFGAASINTAVNVELDIENCGASNNQIGVFTESTSTGIATVRVSNSTVTHNGAGLDNSTGAPAVLLSRGNNTVEGNVNNTQGPIGSYTAK
jgi:hypothetical protein